MKMGGAASSVTRGPKRTL